jgi:hypothetical protein
LNEPRYHPWSAGLVAGDGGFKIPDRADLAAEEKIRFTSSILPKWARRTKSLDALLPILYLRGVSTGDFQVPGGDIIKVAHR